MKPTGSLSSVNLKSFLEEMPTFDATSRVKRLKVWRYLFYTVTQQLIH